MKIENIKSPEDILEYMKENIKYGWLDINNEEHIGNMKNFRRLYRTMTIEETISHGIGTCIEQVNLMSMLLNKLNIPNKMFCTRIYEGDNFNDLEAEEHMHCFVLYYLNNKVYQIEHPSWMRIGIYEFASEEAAIKELAMERCQMSYVLSDHSKFNKVYHVTFGQINDAVIITDHCEKEIKEQATVVEVRD